MLQENEKFDRTAGSNGQIRSCKQGASGMLDSSPSPGIRGTVGGALPTVCGKELKVVGY